jgi:adenylate kinase
MPEVVKKRLEVYSKETKPLIEYYRKKKIIVDVDAYPEIKEVFKRVEKETRKQ